MKDGRITAEEFKWKVARWASLTAHRSGLLGLLERLRPKRTSDARLIALCYHRVTTDASTIHTICVSPENFRSQMAFLAHGPYKPISLSTWQRYLNGEEKLVGDFVAVTFDDGYRDNYEAAYPILCECGVPATIYVTTGALDAQEPAWWDRVVMAVYKLRETPDLVHSIADRIPDPVRRHLIAAIHVDGNVIDHTIVSLVTTLKVLSTEQHEQLLRVLDGLVPYTKTDLMLTWDMLRAMRSDLIEFGSHTVAHPFMSRLTEENARKELGVSKTRIEEELGKPIALFAYPNGKHEDYNAQTISALRACGYALALTTKKGINDRQTPPLELYRIGTVDYPAYVLAARLCMACVWDDIKQMFLSILGRARR